MIWIQTDFRDIVSINATFGNFNLFRIKKHVDLPVRHLSTRLILKTEEPLLAERVIRVFWYCERQIFILTIVQCIVSTVTLVTMTAFVPNDDAIKMNLLLYRILNKHITKTCLCKFDPLKPHFYIDKLGVYRGKHYFSYFRSKHRLWVLVRTTSLRRF